MIYEFEDTQTGERVDLDFPIGKAPGLGETVVRDGRTLVRVCSIPAFSMMGAKPFKPHVSNTQERWDPAAPAGHDSEGRAIIDSRKTQMDFAHRINERNAKAGKAERLVINDS